MEFFHLLGWLDLRSSSWHYILVHVLSPNSSAEHWNATLQTSVHWQSVMATAGPRPCMLRKVMGKKTKKTLSRLGCQQIQRQKPALTSGQKLGSDYLKLYKIDTAGLESLSSTSQVNHNKSLKRKGQTCEVLFVFTETSSPTHPQPNQQRNQLPLVRLKPDPRNERRTWPLGEKETTNEPLSPSMKG